MTPTGSTPYLSTPSDDFEATFDCGGSPVKVPRVVAQGITTIALVLLAASGVSKALDPNPTRGALRAARLPSSRPAIVALGVLEVVAAAAGMVAGGRWVAPAVALYLGFTVFTFAAVRGQIPVQSCGCFGREDTPPTALHVAYNLTVTIALGYLMITGQPAVPWSGPGIEIALFLGYSVIGAYLSYLVLAQLPRTLSITNLT